MYVNRRGRFMQSQPSQIWKSQIHFYNRDCQTLILHLPVTGIKHVSCTIVDILDNLCLMVDLKILLSESAHFLSDCSLYIQCLPLITCQQTGKQNCNKDNQELECPTDKQSKIRTNNLWPRWFCQCLREENQHQHREKNIAI